MHKWRDEMESRAALQRENDQLRQHLTDTREALRMLNETVEEMRQDRESRDRQIARIAERKLAPEAILLRDVEAWARDVYGRHCRAEPGYISSQSLDVACAILRVVGYWEVVK